MVTTYVTDKKIPMDVFMIQKLDLMIKRCTQKNPKLDAVFENEGGEGSGKTTLSVAQGYYVSYVTKRPFSEKNVFLDTKEAVNFAQNTEEQIIIFDEPALDALSAQWWNEVQQDLVKLLMLSRKKRHFIIFNFTKFWKFVEYIVVDRCIGMAHLYERRDKIGEYAYAYIPKDNLPRLYNDYRYKKQRNYFKYALFTGQFPDVLNPDKKYNLLDVFNMAEYDRKKDKAIQSIGKGKANDLKAFKHKISMIKFPIKNQLEFCKQLKMTPRTFQKWKKNEFDDENKQIQFTVERIATNDSSLLIPIVEKGKSEPSVIEQ